jgi:hypothetical protein
MVNTVRAIKAERIIWGEGPMYIRVWWGTLWETGGMKDLEIYKIILKKFLEGIGRRRVELSGSGYGKMTGCCEHVNEPWKSINFLIG